MCGEEALMVAADARECMKMQLNSKKRNLQIRTKNQTYF